MKRIATVGVLTLVLVLAFAGVAYANFGPHGSYSGDTDACAGCHRAHTAFSTVARTDDFSGDPMGEGSALLVSSATTMSDFCYACHGDDAPGAATNVEVGIFDSGPSGADGDVLGTVVNGVTISYVTSSTFGATLNGGGFASVNGTATTSMHNMDPVSLDPIWGAGQSVTDDKAVLSNFTCTNCHDPHGSSNYRLLRDTLLGTNVVGGYLSDTNPEPFVISAEIGYPADGFVKHAPATGYVPDHTTPLYRYNGDPSQSMSGWCAGCHEQYILGASAYDYGSSMTAVNEAVELEVRTFHRHPVNMNLETGRAEYGMRTLATDVQTDTALPLEMAFAKDVDTYRGTKDFQDVVGCLTCHFAHGTDAAMSGWSESSLDTSLTMSSTETWFPILDDGSGGVNPTQSSALLRVDERGVCERCHNK